MTRATRGGWVMTVGEMLSPVVSAMRKELLASGYIQADETPVDVQTTTSAARIIKVISGSTARRAAV